MADQPRKIKKTPTPSNWASLKPFGMGEQHPNHYDDSAKAIFDSRDQLQYGGPHRCADWRFATADGRGHFSSLRLPPIALHEGMFDATARRGKPGHLQVHWPEGKVVVPRGHRSPKAGITDYNALVSVERT